MTAQLLETEAVIDRSYLDELTHWVKTLNSAGVSPDKAAEIAKDFMLHACAAAEYESEDDCCQDDE